MFIESLQITAFASLHGFSLDLREGLNVLYGKNEAGKSTVAEFIRYVLYGFASKADRERYLGFSDEGCEGSLIVRDGDKRYRVERKTVGSKEHTGICDLDTGARLYEGRVPGEALFGLPAALFASTVFVGQAGGSRISGKGTAEAVDNLLFAADEGINVKKALKRLDDERVYLLHKNKKGGRLYELDNELSHLTRRAEKAEQDSGAVRELEYKIRQTDVEYEERRLRTLNTLLDDYALKQSRERRERLSLLEAAYHEVDRAHEAHRQAYTRGGFFPDTTYLDRLKECASEVVRCNDQIALYEKRLDALNREIESHNNERDERLREQDRKRTHLLARRSVALAAAILSLLLFLAAGTATAFLFLTAKTMMGSSAAVLTLAAFGGMLGGFTLSARYTSDLRLLEGVTLAGDDGYRERLQVLSEDMAEQKEKRRRYKQTLDDLCARWEVSYSQAAVTEMREVMEEEKRLSNELEKARIAYVQFKTEMEEHFDREPEDDGREVILPEKFDVRSTENTKKLAEKILEDKRRTRHEAELRLTHLSAVAEPPAKVWEEKLALEEEKARLQERYEAYVLAAEKIETAAETMRASVSPRLAADAGRHMATLTEGKYEELGVDSEMKLSFRPVTKEGGRITKEEAFMSAGTSDIAYVSLRLALLSFLCEDRLPPMIFDETFSRMDEDRLSAVLRLLAQAKGQVLLLSSSRREGELLRQAGLAAHTVNL